MESQFGIANVWTQGDFVTRFVALLLIGMSLASWIVIVIIAREFIISGFRLVASDNGIVIAASYWGKFKTVFQMAMVIVLIMDLGGAFDVIGQALIWISLALTIISLIDYVAKNIQVLTNGGM